MSNLKVVLNKSGVRNLLRSQEMMNICTEKAYEAKSRLGAGHEVTYRTGKNRVNASIAAATSDAINENKRNNSILKALR